MPWEEIHIKLYCIESDWTHNISLCFESKLLLDYFFEAIEHAKGLDNDDITTLKVSQGAVEPKRHFINDYKKERKFEVTIGEKVTIKNVSFTFEKDNSSGVIYDNMFMKNIVLKFKNSDCQFSK